jgi:ketosteroid isomerase-like protein
VLDTDNIDVYTVEDGKIVAAKIYMEDVEQEDAFWGK